MCSPLALSDIDDEIWPRYAEAYAAIPEISKGYPNQTTLMSVNPDFVLLDGILLDGILLDGILLDGFVQKRLSGAQLHGE